MNAQAYFELLHITNKIRDDVEQIRIRIAELERAGIFERDPIELDDELKQIIGD